MMHPINTSPSAAWIRRLVLGLAGLALILSAGVLFLGFDPFGPGDIRSIETVPVVLGLGVLGGVLIAIEQGYRNAAWLALGPALLGLVSWIENGAGGVDHLGIDRGERANGRPHAAGCRNHPGLDRGFAAVAGE
jgi:hypothetical protein